MMHLETAYLKWRLLIQDGHELSYIVYNENTTNKLIT